MRNLVSAAVVAAILVAGASSISAQEMPLIARAARVRALMSRAEALAWMNAEPTAVENRRYFNGLAIEAIKFEGPTEQVTIYIALGHVVGLKTNQTIAHSEAR